ncbi:F-box/LRR-repeat protein At4g14096-like [Papaver somniferum]|uniref:F-box/LRR-repeat protein At4g14096-like n=1 Tax=Papaver somniferum TaxID=3469 RepID=UPI000E6F69E1|nr:F-box/LRR-repeat protein At4g14096-like [Papaver somniferum]
MDFVDRTFHLHDPSSIIQKFDLGLNTNMNASRVISWIGSLTKRNVEDLSVALYQDDPFPIPSSIFTCESLVKLYLYITPNIYCPKNISFQKLKSLTLNGVQFTGDSWNDQLFVNCPVLEELVLEDCSWFGIKKICILTPLLKQLQIVYYYYSKEDDLCDYYIQIHAPSLASLTYWGIVAKDYDLSSFLALDKAEVNFHEHKSTKEPRISQGEALSKFLQALSHVRSLSVHVQTGQVQSIAYDFVNNLPTFHNLNELELLHGAATTNKEIFALLRAAPNLRCLVFDESSVLLSIDEKDETDKTEDLFRHLQSVLFVEFSGEVRELRWAELILKNAKSLQTMTIEYGTCHSKEKTPKSKEVVMSELLSFPRASWRCVVKFI